MLLQELQVALFDRIEPQAIDALHVEHLGHMLSRDDLVGFGRTNSPRTLKHPHRQPRDATASLCEFPDRLSIDLPTESLGTLSDQQSDLVMGIVFEPDDEPESLLHTRVEQELVRRRPSQTERRQFNGLPIAAEE
jgi:hypothetical protein